MFLKFEKFYALKFLQAYLPSFESQHIEKLGWYFLFHLFFTNFCRKNLLIAKAIMTLKFSYEFDVLYLISFF